MDIWYINLRKSFEIQTSLDLFKCIANRFKRAGYTLDTMWQTACLVFYPIMVEGYAALFSSMYVAMVQASDSMTASM